MRQTTKTESLKSISCNVENLLTKKTVVKCSDNRANGSLCRITLAQTALPMAIPAIFSHLMQFIKLQWNCFLIFVAVVVTFALFASAFVLLYSSSKTFAGYSFYLFVTLNTWANGKKLLSRKHNIFLPNTLVITISSESYCLVLCHWCVAVVVVAVMAMYGSSWGLLTILLGSPVR